MSVCFPPVAAMCAASCCGFDVNVGEDVVAPSDQSSSGLGGVALESDGTDRIATRGLCGPEDAVFSRAPNWLERVFMFGYAVFVNRSASIS